VKIGFFVLVGFFMLSVQSLRAQKKLAIIDTYTKEEVKRIDFSKPFSYKLRNSENSRNGFVTNVMKDTVRLNTGPLALKNFELIRQNKKASPFLNTASDMGFYGGVTALSLSILFYTFERGENVTYPGSNNYQLTKTSLVIGAGMGAAGGILKLLTRKKSIELGGRFQLVIN
jgi:hypothetical protein